MKIAIIGAGPAGMMAVIAVKGDIVLFDGNEKCGKKLYITGKGRCNITNNADISDFIEEINRNPYFCYSSLYSFTNQDLIRFLEKNGLAVKVERGERVFPRSDKSSDVIKTLEKAIRNKGAEIRLHTKVLDIQKEQNGFLIVTDKGTENFDRCIIATGGLSYSSTGSTGFGFKIAEKFGHKIIEAVPSLVPIRLKEHWISDLKGLSLRNVRLTYKKKSNNFSYFGDLLFNDDGITGPVALKMSSHSRNFQKGDPFYLDLKPALTREQMERRVLRDFNRYSNKELQNGLKDLLPKRMIEPIIEISSLDKTKKIHQITKSERDQLIKTIKELPLTFKELRGFREAIITNGGICTNEIDSGTMESKLVKGLYFAGEIIDIDAMTGGFNLQLAFSTGYLAGQSCGESYE